ncbi:MAG: DUF3352 domain-containing protein [Prochlorococcaceae cyanobacterium]
MRARPFLAAVLAVALVLLSLGLAGWWLVWQRSPLQLAHQPLRQPLAARFVPRQAPFSLHLLAAPDTLVGYARAVAPARQRRQAAENLDRLRDGAFAAAGLDYVNELAPWLGDETSLALFGAGDRAAGAGAGADGAGGWLLALRSRDPEGARRFLQRFWQTRSLAGTDLQISSYRGMGLISGRGALVGQESVPLATALVNDDLVLLASGRGVLEQALDVSQIDELNQAGQPRFRRAIAELEQGTALISARPGALAGRLGLAAAAAADPRLQELVAVIRPEGRALAVQGLLSLRQPLPALQLSGAEALLDALRGDPASLALLANPAAILGQAEPQTPAAAEAMPLASLLRAALAAEAGPLPALVAAADGGPLLWARQAQGWLLASRSGDPQPEAVASALQAQGFGAAPLQAEGQTLQVWTRLQSAPQRGDPDQLQVSLAGARFEQGPLAWWGEGLAVLEQQRESRQQPRQRREQLAALNSPTAAFQWAMGAKPARKLLAAWQPWRLLGALAGGLPSEAVDGLALSVEVDPAGALRLRGRLELA